MAAPRDISDIDDWLKSIGFGQYVPNFHEHQVDLEALPHLLSEDLLEIGILPIIHRKKIMVEARVYKQKAVAGDGEGAWHGRLCAVLFVDLSKYAEFCNTLNVEDLQTLEFRFLQAMETIVNACGGTVADTQGDALIGLFGYPTAHENDALRACAAAVRMHEAAKELSDELREEIGLGMPIGIHIGITFGEIIKSGDPKAQEGSGRHLTGSALTLSARLSDAAQNGQTLVTDRIQQLVADSAICREHGTLVLQGLPEPVKAYELLGLRSASRAAITKAFVDRDAERGRFLDILMEVERGGVSRAVVVTGEAGIGKSRFASEACRMAVRRGARNIDANIIEFGGLPQRSVAQEIIRQGLQIPAQANEAVCVACRDRFLARRPDLAEQRAFIDKALGLSLRPVDEARLSAMAQGDIEHQEKQLALSVLLDSARDHPLILRIEDVHWGRARDLLLIDYLLQNTARERILFLLTVRSHAPLLLPGLKAILERATTDLIELAALASEDLRRLDVANSIADECQLGRLVERSNGNPLFFEQLAIYAGGLGPAEESHSSIPLRIKNIVQARTDRLALHDRMALDVCAVFGESFDPEAVRAIIGDPHYSFATLIEHNFICERSAQHAFVHNLLRESIYDRLLRSKKRKLHLQIARWFENRNARLRAEHLEKASSPSAAEAFLRAAEEFAFRYDFQDALEMIERGLACNADPRTAFDILFLKGELLSKSYRYGEANAAFDEALEKTGDSYLRLQAVLNISRNLNYMDLQDAASEALDAAEALAASVGVAKDAAEIARQRGQIEHVRGSARRCLEFHKRARDLAYQSQSHESIVDALCGLGMAYFVSGNVRMGKATFDEAIEFASDKSMPHAVTEFEHMRAWHSILSLKMDEAYEIGARSREAGAEIHNQRAVMSGTRMQCYSLFERARFAEAECALEECLALCRRVTAKRFEPVILGFLARAAQHCGREREARSYIVEAAELLDGLERWVGPMVYGCIASVSRDPEEIDGALAAGSRILERGCGFHNYFSFLRDAINISMIHDRWEDARKFADMLAGYDNELPMEWTKLQQRKVTVMAPCADASIPSQDLHAMVEFKTALAAADLGYEVRIVDQIIARRRVAARA